MDNPAMPLVPWPALAAAHDHAPERRLPVLVGDAEVGSVARGHLPALAAFAEALTVADDAVRLVRPAALAHINEALRRDGLIVGWRDETYALVDPATLRRLGRLERAASRFWGTLTFGAHCNGYVAGLQLLSVAEALALAASDEMTVDSSPIPLASELTHES